MCRLTLIRERDPVGQSRDEQAGGTVIRITTKVERASFEEEAVVEETVALPGGLDDLAPAEPVAADDHADLHADLSGALPSEDPEAEEPKRAPWDIYSVLLGGIFAILALAVLYVGRELAIPVVLAFMASAVLQPAMRLLARVHLPRFVSALILVVLVCGLLVAVFLPLAGPAADWFSKAPSAVAKLEGWVDLVKAPLQQLAWVNRNVENLTGGAADPAGGVAVTVKGDGLGTRLFSGTRAFAAGLFTTLLLLFFLLIAGDMFLRRLIEIVPNYSNKKQVIEISREIESNISRYLVTVSVMNLAVGSITGLAAWLAGLPDPLLWGTLAFLFNYIPIIGPLCCSAILFLAGLLTFDSAISALVPAGAYLAVHLIEADSITPMLLAKRFTLNPVLVVLSIVFWYTMWGFLGAFLAVPMLAAFKLVCDRVQALAAIGHFISGDAKA